MAAQQIQNYEDLIQYSIICPWCELPPDLEMKIMERLPLECCCQLRSVCKGWNDLLSSTRFNHIMGSESASSSRQPRLLLCTPKMEMACLIYSFSTNSWRTISLSFLLLHDVCGQLNYRGSASGLLLLDLPPFSCWGNMQAPLSKLCVCNPLNKSLFLLPQRPSVVRVMAKGIVPGDELGSYVVFVIGMKTASNNSVVTVTTMEAYDSLSKSWRTAGTLPNNLVINNDNLIFSKGLFYCLNGDHDRHVVAYNIKEGNATIITMPATDRNDHYWPRLLSLSCRGASSDLLMVGAIEEDHLLKDLVIWELIYNLKIDDHNSENNCWREIARMPASVCDEFRRRSWSNWFECIGVGEFICFRGHESTKVVSYNVAQGSWSCLPECPPAYAHYKNVRLNSMALELRPDMKVMST